MFFIFKWKEVYFGYSPAEHAKVRDCLSLYHIKYKYEVINHSSHNRGKFGTFGIKVDYEKQYYIYVKKTEYERAEYLVNIVLNRV